MSLNNPAIRKYAYGLVALAMALLLAFDIVTAEQVTFSVDMLERAVVALTSLMAYLKTDVT